MYTNSLIGPLLTLASGKAERRQVHPLQLHQQLGWCSRDCCTPYERDCCAPIGIYVFYVRTITNKIQFAKKIYHIYQQQHNLLAFSKTKAGRFPIFQLSYQDIYQPICQFSIENTHNRRFII